MSTSTVVGPYPGDSRHDDQTSVEPTSTWLAHPGEPLKLRVRVESIERRERRVLTYVVRAESSNDLLEWSTPRRHGIAVGDRLALSGVVKAHVTRNDTPVTLLRDCFNPLRMA